MKRRIKQLLKAVLLGLVFSFAMLPAIALGTQNTSKGEIKKSGSEVKQGSKSLGKNVKHGRVVRGGKQFGKHMGRAGKHFGRSSKKFFKRVVS